MEPLGDTRDRSRDPCPPAAGRADLRQPKRVDLPLPAPDEEGGTRVRLSSNLTPGASELPYLPPEPEATTRFEKSVPELDIDGGFLDDRTMVDTQPVAFEDDEPGPSPSALRFQTRRDARLSELTRDQPETNFVRSPPLPLPAPAGNTPRPTEKLSRPPIEAELARPTHRPLPRIASQSGDCDQSTAVAADPMAALRSPLVGGRYRVVSRIGAGGMGKVFKVTHAQLGKTFALKIINENLANDGKARDLFYREARLASSLSHPNIASVVDFGEDDTLGAFMVMELLEGEPLNVALRRERKLGVKQTADIVFQIAEALHYIHSNRIVHCDIKTENILLCEVPGTKRRNRQVKLLDFGLARSTNAGRNTASLSGTPHYVAPERIRGEQAGPSADIYGLGILFYELLTGKVPWDGNIAQILAGHLELQPTPPSQLIEGGLDPAVETLILRALAKSPADRHKDMAAFIYELRTTMDMLGFGRRGKRGASRRVVIERTENKRDELARAVLDVSRIPHALISADGTILLANAAFAKFIMGVAVDVEGLRVQATPLASVWPTFDSDLSRACSGHSIKRMLEVDVSPAEVRRLLMWLDPGVEENQALFGVHPLDA